MNPFRRDVLMAGVIGVLAGIGATASVQAQGIALKPGCTYSIGFQDGTAPGAVAVNNAPNTTSKGVATYRVMAGTPDQQWYRLRMVTRNPAGGWYTPPGAPEVWVNLNYVMWVQEVLR